MRSKDELKEAKRLHKLAPGELQPIDLRHMPYIPDGMTSAYRNNRYTVMIYKNTPMTGGIKATKAMVQRHDDKPLQNHWRELQKIKNELFGEEATGIEYYPAESKLMDVANIYWLWIFPEGSLPIWDKENDRND